MNNDTDAPERRGRAIKQFMWAWQPHFRIAVETRIQLALEAIGFWGNPEVLLVGFQVAGTSEFPICIEPETGPYAPSDLTGVEARGTELYEQHPDCEIFHTDAGTHKSFHNRLRNGMRAEAIAEALSATTAGQGRTFFASPSVQVADYDVHIVISVDGAALSQVPQLTTTRRNRLNVHPSPVHAVVREIFTRSIQAMYAPDGYGDIHGETVEVIRAAASNFVYSTLVCVDQVMGHTVYADLCAVSALPYEGRSSSGKLVLAKFGHPAISVTMSFRHKIDLDDKVAVRKLLEIARDEDTLLSDGEHVYGIGRVDDTYDESTESVFTVSFTERGLWELSHNKHPLLSVQDGVPRLSTSPLNVALFTEILEHLIAQANIPTLIELARAAGQHDHGAMLIISSEAADEAVRLAPQAWTVEPVPLSPPLLRRLTSMDGGVLVDPQGHCYAVGVILDGLACGDENPARGSRFNNAIRYLGSNPPPAVVVVYSVDGKIDILPKLPFRVHRSVVRRAVEEFLDRAIVPPKPGLSDARDVVRNLRFYLSAEQCQQINGAQAALDKWTDTRGNIRIVYQDLKPNPKMNDSYWLPE